MVAGHYIAVPGTSQASPSAMITSPTYAATTGECLQFYYHILGTGSLFVYTSAPSGSHGPAIWSQVGALGRGWRKGQVTLKSAVNYQVNACWCC